MTKKKPEVAFGTDLNNGTKKSALLGRYITFSPPLKSKVLLMSAQKHNKQQTVKNELNTCFGRSKD